MKKIYIAGALNSDACGYIQNLHRMIATANTANKIRRLDFAVFVPGIDFLMGIVDDKFTYKDYFENSQPFLEVCDAVFLTPGYEQSECTAREIELAKSLNIPVFDDIKVLKKIIK